MRLKLLLFIAALSVSLVAHADEFNFTATGSGINSSGTIVAVADPTTANAFDVESISGTYNGSAIALLPCATYDPANSCDNTNPYNFYFDNLLYISAGQPFLDFSGIGFSVGTTGYESSFYYDNTDNPGTYRLFDNNNFTEPLDSFTVTPVAAPEPDTLILFGSGLLGMFGLIRRQLQS
jgi:hypothetical protein